MEVNAFEWQDQAATLEIIVGFLWNDGLMPECTAYVENNMSVLHAAMISSVLENLGCSTYSEAPHRPGMYITQQMMERLDRGDLNIVRLANVLYFFVERFHGDGSSGVHADPHELAHAAFVHRSTHRGVQLQRVLQSRSEDLCHLRRIEDVLAEVLVVLDVESEQRAELDVHGVEDLLRACVHLVADGILNHIAHELIAPLFSCCCHVVCVCVGERECESVCESTDSVRA